MPSASCCCSLPSRSTTFDRSFLAFGGGKRTTRRLDLGEPVYGHKHRRRFRLARRLFELKLEIARLGSVTNACHTFWSALPIGRCDWTSGTDAGDCCESSSYRLGLGADLRRCVCVFKSLGHIAAFRAIAIINIDTTSSRSEVADVDKPRAGSLQLRLETRPKRKERNTKEVVIARAHSQTCRPWRSRP